MGEPITMPRWIAEEFRPMNSQSIPASNFLISPSLSYHHSHGTFQIHDPALPQSPPHFSFQPIHPPPYLPPPFPPPPVSPPFITTTTQSSTPYYPPMYPQNYYPEPPYSSYYQSVNIQPQYPHTSYTYHQEPLLYSSYTPTYYPEYHHYSEPTNSSNMFTSLDCTFGHFTTPITNEVLLVRESPELESPMDRFKVDNQEGSIEEFVSDFHGPTSSPMPALDGRNHEAQFLFDKMPLRGVDNYEEQLNICNGNLDKMEMDQNRRRLEEEEDSSNLKIEIRDKHKTEKEEASEHPIEEIESPVASTVSSPNHLPSCVLQILCEPPPIPQFASSTPPPQLTLQLQPSITTARLRKIDTIFMELQDNSHTHKVFDLMPKSNVSLPNKLIQMYFSYDPYYNSFPLDIPPPRPPSQPPDISSSHENPLTPSPQFTPCSSLPQKLQPQLSRPICQLKLDFPLFSLINFLGCLPQAEMRFKGTQKIQGIIPPINLIFPFKNLIAPAHNELVLATYFVLSILSGVNLKLQIHETVGNWPTREWAIGNEEFQREVGKHMGMSSPCAISIDKDGNAVPSCAFKRVEEGLELGTRKSNYLGKCILKAPVNGNTTICHVLIDIILAKQIEIFMVQQLIEILNEWGWCKQKLGVDGLLVLSSAACKMGVTLKRIPIYKHITKFKGNKNLVLAVAALDVINNRIFAGTKLTIHELELMTLPIGAPPFKKIVKIGWDSYHYFKAVVKKKYGQNTTNIGGAQWHLIWSEGFLSWWPHDDKNVSSDFSEGYILLLTWLLEKHHDVASLATCVLHRLLFYEVVFQYESDVPTLVGRLPADCTTTSILEALRQPMQSASWSWWIIMKASFFIGSQEKVQLAETWEF